MRRWKDYYVTIILIATVIIINIAAFGLYIENINKDIEKQTKEHLAEMMEDASLCVELKAQETIYELEMTAYYIGLSENYHDAEVMNHLSMMTKKAGFNQFDIMDINGAGLAENNSSDYSQTRMFRKVMSGDVYITDTKDEAGNSTGILFAVPIVDAENVIKGGLITQCSLDEFDAIMDLDAIKSKGKAFIIKPDGTVLSRKEKSSIQNVADILNDESHVKTLKSYMKSKKSGVIEFDNDQDSKRYICFSRTEFSNWQVIMVVSPSSVEANINDVTDNFVFLGVIIGAMLALLIGYFIYTLLAVQSKNAMNLRRYYMVSRYTDDIIFDYSCLKDTIYCNEKWKKIFGYEMEKENVTETMKKIIVKEDYEEYKKQLTLLNESDELVQFKCRILDAENQEIPCLWKVFGVKNSRKKLIKIVGVIEKIVS